MRDHDSDISLTLLEQLGEQSDEDAWSRLYDLYSPLLQAWLARKHRVPITLPADSHCRKRCG
jgi:hypothetical protein